MTLWTLALVNLSICAYIWYTLLPVKGTLANSEDLDQMSQNAASVQGLQCLY